MARFSQDADELIEVGTAVNLVSDMPVIYQLHYAYNALFDAGGSRDSTPGIFDIEQDILITAADIVCDVITVLKKYPEAANETSFKDKMSRNPAGRTEVQNSLFNRLDDVIEMISVSEEALISIASRTLDNAMQVLAEYHPQVAASTMTAEEATATRPQTAISSKPAQAKPV